MKLPDQCPSTVKTKVVPETRDLIRANGRAQWRSIEEFAGEPAFNEFVQREFPAGASELLSDSRRTFLKLMGASLALAGAATIPGCRRPDYKILPYSKEVPEEVIPGEALYYATSTALPGGGAEGLLVETHEARPTKIEGNPLHEFSNGRSSAFAQASMLQLYDTDRLMEPVYRGRGDSRSATWDDFRAWAHDHFGALRSSGGAGLAFIVDKKTTPSRDELRDEVLRALPQAEWVAYNPAESSHAVEGARVAFGSAQQEVLHLDRASVIVSLDRDFLDCAGPDGLMNARTFATGRRVEQAGDAMSRVYVFESVPSKVGGAADHRWRVSPSRIPAVAVALAKEILSHRPVAGAESLAQAINAINVPQGPDISAHDIEEVAKDLLASTNRTRTLIVAGANQPAEVHALVHAMNQALECVGTTIEYKPMSDELATDSSAALAQLSQRMRAGEINTVVCIDTNPVYDAPASLGFAEHFAHVPHTITLSVGATETAAASEWSLNGAHYLEAWGDTEAFDGTMAPTQPMIAPLYGDQVMSELELLAFIAGREDATGHAIVRDQWARRMGHTPPSEGEDAAFEKMWRRSLHNGVFPMRGARPAAPSVRFAAIAAAVTGMPMASAPTMSSLDVVFTTGNVGDGRYANCGWLQELPHFGSMVCWDNPAMLSPKTASDLGLLPTSEERIDRLYTKERYPQARMATVRVNGHELAMAVWVVPGMADNTIMLPLGYGRTVCGRVGGDRATDVKVGFNTYALKNEAMTARGATLTRINQTYTVASTQNHWSMESRDSIVRAIDRKWWDEHAGSSVHQHSFYEHDPDPTYAQDAGMLNIAEQLGEMAHTPPNTSIYKNPYNDSRGGPKPNAVYAKSPQWGMTIDLAACTGCGACTVACQSENNIPIVGKAEVARGREMQWIRVDRYFTGHDTNSPDEILHQPVACVQCENAPCETVCPVNATVHGPEGINYMVYNRCIGTRYCANNCPYKVRRFNFFDYGVKEYNGGYREGIDPDTPKPDNINWIPPRLRAQLAEIEKMGKNPNVTVRSRGVMEKCTYCIQRINKARAETKIRDLNAVPDGFFQVACQQACPSEAIEFGDILDTESRVTMAREGNRSYLLLGYLNTRPRTSYLMRVRNPNPAIRPYEEDPLAHGSHGDDHGGDGHEGENNDGHGDDGGHAFFNRAKTTEDAGYAMSLKVIGVGGSA